MRNIIRKMILMVMVLAVLFSVAIPKVGAIPAASTPIIDEMGVVNSSANAEENAINNESGWACLLDRSGSMRDKEDAINSALAILGSIVRTFCKHRENLCKAEAPYRGVADATKAGNNGGANGKETTGCAGCTVNVNLHSGCGCGKGIKTCEMCTCNATGAISNATDDSSDASANDDNSDATATDGEKNK